MCRCLTVLQKKQPLQRKRTSQVLASQVTSNSPLATAVPQTSPDRRTRPLSSLIAND
jgi:hypothetical protein